MAMIPRNPGHGILRFTRRVLRLETSEPPKVPVTESRRTALAYDSIHILPAAVAVFLIVINLIGCYIGEHLGSTDNDGASDGIILAFIQVFAKIQELFILASLAAILLHLSLSAVLSDHGLPLGLATSGFSFARVSYFWSPAFWGGAIGLYRQRQLTGAMVVFLLLLSGLLATVVGPASAVLMLPRTNKWLQFTTHFWLNGTTDDFWPSKLTEKHFAPNKKCIAGRPGGVCVSAGLPMLATYLAYSKNTDGGFVITTPEMSFPRLIEGAPRLRNLNAEAWSFAPHASTSLVLINLWKDPHWSSTKGKPTGKFSGEVEAEAVAVRTVCDPIIGELSNKTQNICLPNLSAFDLWSRNNTNLSNFDCIGLRETLWGTNNSNSMTHNENMTTIFIPPSADMTSVTAGVLVLGPQNHTRNRFAMACSVDARWNRALHTMKKSDDHGIGDAGNPIAATLRGTRKRSELSKAALPLRNGDWRHISAEPTWLEAALGYDTHFTQAFQPYSIGKGGLPYRTTALGALIIARVKHLADLESPLEYWSNNTDAVESVISTTFADAISRVGIERQQLTNSHTPTESVQTCQQISNKYSFCPPPPRTEISRWTRLKFSGFTTGYAYKASKATDYVSIALLTIYVLMVAIYLVISAMHHRSFLSWNTIEELLLLAQNSTSSEICNHNINHGKGNPIIPTASQKDHVFQKEAAGEHIKEKQPHPLMHTSSGILCLATMGLRMKIKAEPRSEHDRRESKAQRKSVRATRRVQMVFTDQEATKLEPVRPSIAYG